MKRLRQEYKERSERLGVATAVERSLPAGSVDGDALEESVARI